MAVQHLMWFEHMFQMQGHVLLSWTEWIQNINKYE